MTNNLSKSKLVNVTRSHDSRTENLAVTHSTSLSNIVDMFFLAGASRKLPDQDLIAIWNRAYTENPILALKCLFWARDIRGGAGERRFFRVIWDHIRDTLPAQIPHDLEPLIPKYGRWDDVWAGLKTIDRETAKWFYKVLTGDFEGYGLLAKWLPRKGKIFSSMAQHLSMTPKELRKLLVEKSNTVEQKMCARQWDDIQYRIVPSVAMNRYRKAFLRNDESRFNAFILDVKEGKEKISAGAIFPHDIAAKVRYSADVSEKDAIIAQWEALPNYMEGSNERILPICDVSGSMTFDPLPNSRIYPIDVCIALGIYTSERNEGLFKDAFITFSGTPHMQYLKGDLFQRMYQLTDADWGGNTNLQASLKLILDRALKYNMPEDEMPTKVLIISDMEFDYCGQGTNLEGIQALYKRSGYKMPQIIFWNVEARNRSGNSPAQFNDQGVALVSGFSPAILKNILAGTITTPEKFVLDVLNSDRYQIIGEVIGPAK